MEKELISIIIPAYNAEREISRCLESILEQTYKNLEILVIDDGSTDDTYLIVKNISHKDSRVKFFSQKNAGVSAARNLGVNKAQGKYMTFVDADDYVREDFIEKMAEHIGRYDLVICGYNWLHIKNESILLEKSGELSREDFFEHMFCDRMITGSCCNKMFSTDIVHEKKICFPDGIIISEDIVFCMSYYQYCKKVFYVSETLYQYCYNEKSCTHLKYTDKTFDLRQVGFLDGMELIENMYQNETKFIIACMSYKKMRFCVNLIFQMIVCSDYNKRIAYRIKQIIKHDYKIYHSYKFGDTVIYMAMYGIYLSPRMVYMMGRIIYTLFGKQIDKYLD